MYCCNKIHNAHKDITFVMHSTCITLLPRWYNGRLPYHFRNVNLCTLKMCTALYVFPLGKVISASGHLLAVEVVVHLSERHCSTGSIDDESVQVELVVDWDPKDGLEVEGVQLLDQPLRGGE